MEISLLRKSCSIPQDPIWFAITLDGLMCAGSWRTSCVHPLILVSLKDWTLSTDSTGRSVNLRSRHQCGQSGWAILAIRAIRLSLNSRRRTSRRSRLSVTVSSSRQMYIQSSVWPRLSSPRLRLRNCFSAMRLTRREDGWPGLEERFSSCPQILGEPFWRKSGPKPLSTPSEHSGSRCHEGGAAPEGRKAVRNVFLRRGGPRQEAQKSS